MSDTGGVAVFSDVHVRYPGASAPALERFSYSLGAGDRVALLGLNGSGKTTLLAATVGLVPAEGRIVVDGLELDDHTVDEIRGRVGFLFTVPEDQLLFPRVLDDVAFALLRHGISGPEARGRAHAMLEALGVADTADASPHHLSHGQRLRVALAGALVADPVLLLLDEPSAGLDPPGRRRLAEHLSQLPAAMLIATHDLDFAQRTCQRYLLLEDGRIAQEGEDFQEVERYWKLDDEVNRTRSL